jgi:hypothetical protein
MTLEEFRAILPRLPARDTCSADLPWSKENPYFGHCTIVSILVQELFGGEILRVDLRHVPGFEHIRWHSWNRLPDRTEVDLTQAQLHAPIPKEVPVFTTTREELFAYGTIKERYELLKARFESLR